MRISTVLSTASLCLATAEGLQFKMYTGMSFGLENVRDNLSKRASTISTTFQYAAPQFSYYVDILVGSAHEFLQLRLSSDPFTWFPGPLPTKNYCNGATEENFSLCIQSNFSGTFDPDGSSTFKNLTSTLNLTSSSANYYLGLGIGGSGSTETSLLAVMMNQKIINVLAYGLYLNDFDTNSSELTIGAIDTAKYDGNLITFESLATTTVQLNTFEYDDATGGSPVTLARSWNANVEFSTGLLYFPEGPLQAITGDVDAYYDQTYGGYLTDCSYRYSKKTLVFNFEGMTITVPATQWIIPAITVAGYQSTLRNTKTPACIVLVDSMDNYSLAQKAGYTAVLGMPFVRATYMVYDFTNQQTSFAQAKLNVTGSSLQSLGTDGVAPFATVVPSTSIDPYNISPTGSPTGSVTGGPGNDGQTTGSPDNGSGGGSKTPIGAIVGGVVGGVVVIAAAIGIFFFLRKRQRRQPVATEPPPQPPMDQTQQPPGPPYPGYDQNQQYNQGYNYDQGGYTELYGQAPNLPNKGYAPPTSPPPQGYVPPHSPMSEMAATPMDDRRHSSVVSPLDPSRHQSLAGVSELPSPREQNMPVELPGHQ
ncbi:Barrierpepsin [Arthrobotrys entomopaga]|nr:Barrierpepsin [Arthrobotrys entomopaga]